MQLDELKKILSGIKECPSNLSQDQIRIVYNENFNLIRKLLGAMVVKLESFGDVVKNIDLLFPENPDERLQHIIKYDPTIEKWRVTEFLGTQNVFVGNDGVLVGGKHQHIVNNNLEMSDNSELIIREGGEAVILKGKTDMIIPIMSGTAGYTSEANMIYVGTYNGDYPDFTIMLNGNPIMQGDMVQIDDVITVTSSSEEGIVLLRFETL